MSNNEFSIALRIKSFKHALAGLSYVAKTQHNAWIHMVAALFAVSIGLWLQITLNEWLLIFFCITLVFCCEIFNTALELLCDAVHPEYHPLIKKAKDVAAGAVLVSAVNAVMIGGFIFIPYIFATIT